MLAQKSKRGRAERDAQIGRAEPYTLKVRAEPRALKVRAEPDALLHAPSTAQRSRDILKISTGSQALNDILGGGAALGGTDHTYDHELISSAGLPSEGLVPQGLGPR